MTRIVFPLAHAAQFALLGVVGLLFVGVHVDEACETVGKWRKDWRSS